MFGKLPIFFFFFLLFQSISPGATRTEIFYEEQMNELEKNKTPFLEAKDVSNAIMYAISTPPHVQVIFHLIKFL